MKKFLAISVLSLGFLSSAPLALCAPGSTNNTNNVNGQPHRKLGYSELMMSTFYLNSTDFTNFLLANKRTVSMSEALKINPAGIYSLQDVQILVPKIETFEDYHQLTPDEDRNKHINEFVGDIKTLIYYPESFDVQRFREILHSNNVEDLKNIRPITKKDPMNNKDVLCFCGNRWECIIHQFNGVDYRVEYVEKGTSKRIIFLFRPSVFKGSIVENFNELLDGYGLREFIDVKNTLKTFIIPSTVKKIGSSAFEECKFLEKINIPGSVKEIGCCAFRGCESLKEITIPNSVQRVNRFAFLGCTSLKTIRWNDHNYSVEEFFAAFNNHV